MHPGGGKKGKEELGWSSEEGERGRGGDMGFRAAGMGNCKIQSQACRSARSPLKSCPSLNILSV